MTEEEKYINKLFKAARNETPKRSFEEVATNFEKAVVTAPITTSSPKLYFKYFSLNTLLMTIISSLVIAGFLWLNPSTIEQSSPITEIEESVIIDQKINEKEKLVATSEAINNQLIKKDIQRKTLETPHKKNNTEVNLTNKKEQKKEVLSIEQPKKIAKPTSNTTVAKTSSIKSKIVTSETPIPKKVAVTKTPSTNSSIATTDTVTSLPVKTKLANKQSQLFVLRNTANKKMVSSFLESIRFYGFSLTEKVNRNAGKIERLNLNVGLFNGLDWKIKLRHFEVFELKILLDEYKNPIGLAYRLNKTDKFSEVIALNSHARSIHKFSKTGKNESHSFTKSVKQKN